jgi:DNA-binding transcriptional ArsR family regulator
MEALRHHAFKAELYAEFARVSSALGNPHRLELVDLLSQGAERSVESLATEARMSVANASQHLRALLDSRLVKVRRDGTRAYYRLAGERVAQTWHALRDLAAAHSAEVSAIVERHLGEREESDIDLSTLLERVARGTVLLLDARPIEEYRAGHLPGARPFPPGDLPSALPALLRDPRSRKRQIVVYCRGPYCAFADEAVWALRKRKLRANRLRIGVPEWRSLGFAVALGEAKPR